MTTRWTVGVICPSTVEDENGAHIATCYGRPDTVAAQIVRDHNAVEAMRKELACVVRCYERDDVAERRDANGVNVHLTSRCYLAIKAALALAGKVEA